MSRISMLLTCLAAVGSLVAGARGQGSIVTFDEGAGGLGAVVSIDEFSGQVLPADPDLVELRFLPIEHSGRVALFEGDLDHPRWHGDVTGASRLELPRLNGSLYRYMRLTSGSGAHLYGFLHIDASGIPHRHLERPGSGPNGTNDPFLRVVGVSPDGSTILAATRRVAGGDVFEVDLDSGAVTNRTATLFAQHVQPGGLVLAADWGVIGTRRGLLRFARLPGAEAELVTFANAPLPTYYQGDVVLSPDGQWAVSVAGSSDLLAHPFVFTRTGQGLRVVDTPMHISPGGFMPTHVHGPFLAINDGGTYCAFRTEGVTRELHLARVPWTVPTTAAPEHVSSDARFLDTLDEVGQAFFARPDRLLFALGELHVDPVDGPEFEGVEFFAAEPPPMPGASVLTNLSLSSNDAVEPFFGVPTMKPTNVRWDGTAERFVFLDEGDAEAIVAVDADGGSATILSNVKDLDLIAATNAGHLFAVRRTNAAGGNRELHRSPLGLGGGTTLVASLPNAVQFDRLAVRRDGWVSFVERSGNGTESLWRIRLGNGFAQQFVTQQPIGPAIAHTAAGNVAFSMHGTAGTFATLLWPAGAAQPVSLNSSTGAGQVLPLD